ncbi:MAG: hypothetical protein B5M53_02095 [Candidatus Cloacimonas sp. 4484_209]|nr:MAG: hypothetical protein B5M53_02095 [Candidatus Cloacimonas sp. 4484_209]
MNILIVSDFTKWSTLDYVLRALEKQGHNIVCFGPYWYHRISCPSNIDDILSSVHLKPDLILNVETHTSKDMYSVLSLERTDIPKVFWAIDNHLNFRWHKEYAYVFDKTYFAQSSLVDYASRYGIGGVEWLPLACDPIVHKDLCMGRDIDVGFIGKMNRKRRVFFDVLRKRLKDVAFGIYEGVYGERMAEIYSRSKIVVNPSVRKDINMRTFEATACGALLLNQDIRDLEKLFNVGEEIDTFGDVDSLVEKIKFYLKNDSVRKRIADSGKKRTLKEHTYQKRIKKLLDTNINIPAKRTIRVYVAYSFTLRHRQFRNYAVARYYLLKALRKEPFYVIYYYIRYFWWYMFEKIRKILKKWPY